MVVRTLVITVEGFSYGVGVGDHRTVRLVS